MPPNKGKTFPFRLFLFLKWGVGLISLVKNKGKHPFFLIKFFFITRSGFIYVFMSRYCGTSAAFVITSHMLKICVSNTRELIQVSGDHWSIRDRLMGENPFLLDNKSENITLEHLYVWWGIGGLILSFLLMILSFLLLLD